ncbi:hypothetical protein LOK49_LG02G01570 [Camellia lanceoleosa]|uniref:Uncharacterized protein n=1 Tax=Camellia lanceoleosa TaxID=1840588 RepID=A0ACC0IN60_9ERIC|nr:hypothetical protein LOK49_LG02G01570 [Camellia lanceoleosa]
MRIIGSSCGEVRSQLLQQSPQPPVPFLHCQLTVVTPRGFSNLKRRFQTPLPTSLISLTTTPKLPLKPFSTTTRSLPDDAAYGSATKVADVDLALAVKNKAIDISPDLKGTSIFLVGIKGAMKTSMGKLLADALRYYYFDSDNLVEEAAGGGSAGKSFRERDKEGFFESETEVLKQLSSMGRLVVCAGNGAVQSTTNLALLRHGLSIWIDVPLDMIARDAIENGSQLSESEIFSSGSYSELAVLYEELKGGYATADTTVSLHKVASQLGHDDLDAVTKEDMALEVLMEIEKLVRVKKMMEEAARPF